MCLTEPQAGPDLTERATHIRTKAAIMAMALNATTGGTKIYITWGDQ